MADNNVVIAQGFDIIGDIHGYVDSLKELLKELGYSQKSGIWIWWYFECGEVRDG